MWPCQTSFELFCTYRNCSTYLLTKKTSAKMMPEETHLVLYSDLFRKQWVNGSFSSRPWFGEGLFHEVPWLVKASMAPHTIPYAQCPRISHSQVPEGKNQANTHSFMIPFPLSQSPVKMELPNQMIRVSIISPFVF